jgi:hypothetical protein
MGEIYEQVNETVGTIKGLEFLDQLSDYHLVNKDSAP